MHRLRLVSMWTKALVALHIVAITSWSLPFAPLPRRAEPTTLQAKTGAAGEAVLRANDHYLKLSPIRQYLLATGFWQYWDMFAPSPSTADLYGTAEIFYANGSQITYEFPRMASMSVSKRYVSERYRKFYERAQHKEFDYLWPTFAQRVADINAVDSLNPPVRVRLTRHWLVIAPPGKPQTKRYKSQTYYDGPVR